MKTALATLVLLALAANCDPRIPLLLPWCGVAVAACVVVIVTYPPRNRYHAPLGRGDD